MDENREKEQRKTAIYDSLSPRRKKFIDRIGFEKWDPFQEPRNPMEVRKDSTDRTSKDLMRQFFHERSPENYSNAYGRGVLEMCMGVVSGDDKCRGMFEFALWYSELLAREDKNIKDGY